MELKLACADFTFPLLSHEQVFKLLAMLGFQGVDLGLFENRSQLQPSHVLPNLVQSAKALSHKVNDAGLTIADVFFQTTAFDDRSANHPDHGERAKGRDLFLRMLEFTVRCNARHMTGLPGIAWEGVDDTVSLKRSAEELAWRAEQGKSVGVVFSVEPHVGSITPSPEQALQLLNMAPGLTVTLDYTHFTRAGIPDAEVEPLVKHASHFHARGARKDRLQASMKENVIDYPSIVRTMKLVGYPGYIGVEYVWQDWEHCNEVDNVSETVLMRDLIIKSFNGVGP